MPWYAELNKTVFSFFLKSLVSVITDQSNVNGQVVPLSWCTGAATENARSDETSLERGTTRSGLPAERREARPGMLATGETNSVRYDGARPLTAWNTKRQSSNLILSAIGNQWSSYIAGVTCSRGPKSWTNQTAALRTLWSGASVDAGKWVSTELQ